MCVSERMIPTRRESGQSARTYETLRDYLLHHGPATAQDLLGILALSRAATYQVIRRAARETEPARGRVRGAGFEPALLAWQANVTTRLYYPRASGRQA